jgi:hypothetical protein
MRDSQIQNSVFKNEKVAELNLQISHLPQGSDDQLLKEEKEESKNNQMETDRTKYVKIDDSYSFTYSMSRNEIKSKSDFSGMSPRNYDKSVKRKTQKRILMNSNKKEYKPKYLLLNKFGKKEFQSDKKIRERKTCTIADKMMQMHNNSVQLRKQKNFRKSANSRMMRKSLAKQFYHKTANSNRQNLTERKNLKQNDFDIEYDLMRESKDSFVKKSMNRLFNLEDLQTVIKKTKKQIRKSTSKFIF